MKILERDRQLKHRNTTEGRLYSEQVGMCMDMSEGTDDTFLFIQEANLSKSKDGKEVLKFWEKIGIRKEENK